MYSLKDCVWDYDNIPSKDQDTLIHAERELSSVIQCMVNKFPGLKVGGFHYDVALRRYTYTFTTVFGHVSYHLVHGASLIEGAIDNNYTIRNRHDKRILTTNSYGYLCRNIFKKWKNDPLYETPEKLAKYPNTYYSNIKSRLSTVMDQLSDTQGRSLSSLKSMAYHEIAYDLSQQDLYGVFSAAFGENIALNKSDSTNSKTYSIFSQLKSYIEMINEFTNNYMTGPRLVISTIGNTARPAFVVSKFKTLEHPFTEDIIISSEYIRTADHLMAIPTVMTRFAMLHAHSGESIFEDFRQGKYVKDKSFPALNSILLSNGDQQILIFPGE